MTVLVRTYSLCRSCCNPKSQLALTKLFTLYSQTRFAGHAKWQNIRHTKQANDLNKGRITSRYVLLVRKAVISGGMQTDPRLNKQLGDVMAEAQKLNIAKATLERAIVRATNVRISCVNLEIQGPGGSSLITRVETDNIALFRREIKKVLKKFDAALLPEDSIRNMFRSQGFIRAAPKTKDERDINLDFAEEAAILANAQDVYEESYDDVKDESLARSWVFTTDAENLDPCRGELEKQGFKVLSSVLELVPYNAIKFSPDVTEQVEELVKALREIDQVVDVYNNVAPSE